MNSEATKVIDQQEETKVKKVGNGEKAAYAVGGFATGVASGVAGSAMAAGLGKEEELVLSIETEEAVATQEAEVVQEQAVAATATTATAIPQPAPNPEEVLLATDEGIRIAQVDDAASFAKAFADARAQVGAGGAFEWRGHVYSTYYEEEWDNMSASERAEYQSKIDYQAVMGEQAETRPTPHTSAEENAMPANTEMVGEQSNHGEVKVLGVEAMTDPQGNPMTVAAIEIEGDQALLVDVDNNGMMDVILVDENHDSQISENEVYDVSEAQISTADLQQHLAASQDSRMMLASNEGMPDYVNDTDVSSMA